MGLAERRAVDNFKKNSFEEHCKSLEKICGFPLKVEIDWGKIENSKEFSYIFDNKKIEEYFFGRMAEAVTHICQDKMGKDAFKENVQKVCFINEPGDLKLEKKVFYLYSSLEGHGVWAAEQIQEFLERHL